MLDPVIVVFRYGLVGTNAEFADPFLAMSVPLSACL